MTSGRRILFVTQTHNVWGGMEQWLHHFSVWLSTSGWELFAAYPRGARFNDPEPFVRANPHLTPLIVDVRAGTERSRVLRLAKTIERVQPDVVLPIASGAVFDAVATAKSRARLIVPVRSLHPDLFCNVSDRANVVDQVVAVSRLIEAVLRALGVPGERIHYVRHGVKPPRHERVARSGPLRAGFVGRLEESTKRVSDLAALARMLGEDVEIHVFGAGPDESLLAGTRVVKHGFLSQEELYERAYPRLDALLLFSPAEGSPNAVYEAMQHGVVPVVARHAGQAAERIVRDGETGITFAVGDIVAAAGALRLLARDPHELARLSTAARVEVGNDTDTRMHGDWERILEQSLALPPLPRVPVALPRAGRLDLLPLAFADALRRMRPQHAADGWAEWPGTAPASPECVARVLALQARLDASGGIHSGHE